MNFKGTIKPCERCGGQEIYFIGWYQHWETLEWIPIFKCEKCYLEHKGTENQIKLVPDGRKHFNPNKFGHQIAFEKEGTIVN